jgi:hypothetical protein
MHPATMSVLLCLAISGAFIATPSAVAGSAGCTVKKDTVLAQNAVGPSWIGWKNPNLPNADLVYVDREDWNLWVMDENGGNKHCLTCYCDNILGVNFPLDEDGMDPKIQWKGDPEAHPDLPVIFFKAENEHSSHKPLRNAPSIGWDNDIWVLDVSKKRYYRLTNLDRGQGLQHTAISEDGKWYVYPLRYEKGGFRKGFGFAKMVFCELAPDGSGRLQLHKRFEVEPNGQMYYEPNDIHRNASGSYSLFYAAGPGKLSDPYVYEWTWNGQRHSGTNKALQTTLSQHEEFFMFSPSGKKIAWMKGPAFWGRYLADLYVSNPHFTEVERVTWYNDCEVWPDRCKPDGAQLSRLEWKNDGTAIFFGLWIHGGRFRPFWKTELHRIDFVESGREPNRQ